MDSLAWRGVASPSSQSLSLSSAKEEDESENKSSNSFATFSMSHALDAFSKGGNCGRSSSSSSTFDSVSGGRHQEYPLQTTFGILKGSSLKKVKQMFRSFLKIPLEFL